MILTGIAKEHFEEWYVNHIRQREDIGDRYFDHTLLITFWDAGDIMINAFIIEWFDSVEIFILSNPVIKSGFSVFLCKINYWEREKVISLDVENKNLDEYNLFFSTRGGAIAGGITEANKIYNEKHEKN